MHHSILNIQLLHYIGMSSKYIHKPARPFRIKNLLSVKIHRFDEEYRFKFHGKTISRVHIVGTIISKYVVEREKERKYASITLDDGSATIRVKSWGEIYSMKNVQEGDIVDVVGKIRVFNDELYIALEKMSTARSIQFELSLRAEQIHDALDSITADMKEELPDFVPINISAEEYEKRQAVRAERANEKQTMLEVLSVSNPMSIAQLMQLLQWSKDKVITIIKELYTAGLILEPQAKHYRKIQ